MTTLEKAKIIKEQGNCNGVSCILSGEPCPLYYKSCDSLDIVGMISVADKFIKENSKMTINDFEVGKYYKNDTNCGKCVKIIKTLDMIDVFIKDEAGSEFIVCYYPEYWQECEKPSPRTLTYSYGKFYGYQGCSEKYMLVTYSDNDYKDRWMFKSITGHGGANGIYDSVEDLFKASIGQVHVFNTKEEYLSWLAE